MAIYQFKLTPLDKFFFGREKHPVRQNYFLESNPFAQQTGVLGLVRHYLLIATGMINEDKMKWGVLIGDKGFDGTQSEFGKIEKIFPLFIWDNKNDIPLFPFKQLDELTLDNQTNVKVSYNNNDVKQLHTVIKNENNPYLLTEQLNLKKNFFSDAFCKEDYSEVIPFKSKKDNFTTDNFHGITLQRINSKNGVYVEHIQPGITKNYYAQKKEDSYFKTQYYKLNKDYAFSFYASIDEDLDTNKTIFMTFGGEASPYRVEISNVKNFENTPFNLNGQKGNIFHFLSDTIIERKNFHNCVNQFIGSTKHFRSMKADLNKIYNLTRDPESIDEFFSKSLLLIKKGSIAFVDKTKINDFINAVKKVGTAYKNIGYNFYKQIDKLQ